MTPDTAFMLLENLDLFWLLAAFAGGILGAMVGANYAFGFTGVSIIIGFGALAGTGSTTILDYVAFGPVFGPHIAFAGGVAAAAYAGRKGLLEGGGKDINTPLAGLGRPDVLLVAGAFGVGGYILQRLITHIPWFGAHTDSVALTVFTSAIVVRLVFGSTPVLHAPTRPDDKVFWLPWQQTPGQILTVSLGASLMAAGAATMIASYIVPMGQDIETYGQIVANAQTIPFAFSALCIFAVASGLKMPVTHHMTIIAGLSAISFLMVSGSGLVALLLGTCFGIITAFVCEWVARAFQNHGDTHIDPPAGSIWLMTTVLHLVLLPVAG